MEGMIGRVWTGAVEDRDDDTLNPPTLAVAAAAAAAAADDDDMAAVKEEAGGDVTSVTDADMDVTRSLGRRDIPLT